MTDIFVNLPSSTQTIEWENYLNIAGTSYNTPQYHLKITLGIGVYEFKTLPDFKCSVTIKGSSMNGTVVYFGADAFNAAFNDGDTPLLDFNYSTQSGDSRGIVRFSNLTMATDISKKCGLSTNPGIGGNMSKILVKVINAKSVQINNVRFWINNGKLSIVQLHKCEDVGIYNSEFHNENHIADVSSEGGNLWFVNGATNVNVQNCEFYKYGEDEALAFYKAAENYWTGSTNKRVWKNIIILNNRFIYGSTTQNETINNVFITLGGYSVTTSDFSEWNNFQFNQNSVIINGPVRFAIMVGSTNKDSVTGFKIINNQIRRNSFGAYPSGWETQDISLCRGTSTSTETYVNTVENYVVYQNFISDSHALTASYYGHTCLLLTKVGVNFSENTISMSEVSNTNNNKAAGLFRADSGNVVLSCSGICAKGLGRLGWIYGGANVTLSIGESFLDGDTYIYSGNPSGTVNCSFTFQNNIFGSCGSPILLWGSQKFSSVTANYNVFRKASGATGDLFTQGGCSATTFTLKLNIFKGYVESSINSSIIADSRTITGNSYI